MALLACDKQPPSGRVALIAGKEQPLCATCLLVKQCCVISDVDPSEHALTERAAELVEGTTVNK